MPTLTTSWNRIIDADAGREQRPERVLRSPAGHEHAPQQQDEQQEQDDAADEPELLGQRGEHEVGRLDRQEVALRLGAVRQALAKRRRPIRPRSAPGRAGSPAPWMSGFVSMNEESRSFW